MVHGAIRTGLAASWGAGLVAGLVGTAGLWLTPSQAAAAAPARSGTDRPAPLEHSPRPTDPSGTPTARQSPFWIGVECHPVGEALRAQLELKEGQGLLVEQVVPDSPAARGKIQPYDVLVKAAGQPLGTVADLAREVDAAQGKPLKLEFLRAGRPTSVEVPPAPRPALVFEEPGGTGPGAGEWDEVLKWLQQARPGDAAGGPVRFRFFQPGAVLPPGTASLPPLPHDMTVTMIKQGAQPAKIQVSKPEARWEVTEKQLDRLPADVRPHVERLLGRSRPMVGWAFDSIPAVTAPPPAVEKRLEEMGRQIDQLRQSLEELRGKR